MLVDVHMKFIRCVYTKGYCWTALCGELGVHMTCMSVLKGWKQLCMCMSYICQIPLTYNYNSICHSI